MRASAVIIALMLVGVPGVSNMGLAQTDPLRTRTSESKIWLDEPLTNWNAPIPSIPAAPIRTGNSFIESTCEGLAREPRTVEDRAVQKLGWTLFEPEQKFGNATIISAMLFTDGMCRPFQYQAFVFMRGMFVGTISPMPMDSRTDGSQLTIRFTNESILTADFNRYGASDAQCCPSRVSRVTYTIQRRNGSYVLTPITVDHSSH